MIFGNHLEGNNPSYDIYVDETGTAENQPVTVVVGIIVHTEKKVEAEALVRRAIEEFVPQPLQDTFIPHATDLWARRKNQKGWALESRKEFFKAMLRVPRKLDLPISVAKIRRDWNFNEFPPGVTRSQFHHALAFGNCAAHADTYIQRFGKRDATARIIAEDVPEMRLNLNHSVDMLRHLKLNIPMLPPFIELTRSERESGIIKQRDSWNINRIGEEIVFVGKSVSPMVQLADACAFAFRRYFSETTYGEEHIRTLIGGDLNLEDWLGIHSFGVFHSHGSV